MNTPASRIAFGGMMTAVAVVIMCMGSLIPVNTYICPVICILTGQLVLSRCGQRTALCHYGAVSILALLLAPDREAALSYVFLGYYPVLKPRLDRIGSKGLRMAAKLALFTLAGAAVWVVLLFVLGLESARAEFRELGAAMSMVVLILWDVLFVLVDRILVLRFRRK